MATDSGRTCALPTCLKLPGEDAALVAAQRADELLAEGDVEGERVFKMILEAVRDLQRKWPEEGERVFRAPTAAQWRSAKGLFHSNSDEEPVHLLAIVRQR
jgi:hypothetical protein